MLRMHFAPRSSEQITSAFKYESIGPTYKNLFVKLFISLVPGRAAGGDYELNRYDTIPLVPP